jgi:DNA-binding NtrC family response regulator
MVARAMHDFGRQAGGPVVVLACHAFPQTLLEIELFGCAGSFAGRTPRRGGIEVASSGTLILENIDRLNIRSQRMLGLVLSTGIVTAADGEVRSVPVRTRVVGTTSTPEPFESHIEWDPNLRERLAEATVRIPSLRERPSDIAVLAEFFAAASNPPSNRVVFSTEAMRALAAYTWPGNVAELQSVVQRLASAGWQGEVPATALPVGIRPRRQHGRVAGRRVSAGEELFARVQASGESFWSSVYPLFMKREITRNDLRDLIRRAFEMARGNADEVVRVLNMPSSERGKFARFLRKYGCELPS